jgi:hypothetical protein
MMASKSPVVSVLFVMVRFSKGCLPMSVSTEAFPSKWLKRSENGRFRGEFRQFAVG